MRKLTPSEKGALILSALLIVAGMISVVRPCEGYILHPSDTGGRVSSAGETREFTSKNKVRIYGGIAIIVGVGIGGLAMYPEKQLI